MRPAEDPDPPTERVRPDLRGHAPGSAARAASMHSHALNAVLAGRPRRRRRPPRDQRPRDAQGHPRPAPTGRPPRAGDPQHAARARARRAGRGRAARSAVRRQPSRSSSRDHGAYIWGADIWETKRHAEVYHFLFEAVLARASTPIQSQHAGGAHAMTALGDHAARPVPLSELSADAAAHEDRRRRRRGGRRGGQAPGHGRLQAHLHRPREDEQRLRLPGPRRSVPAGTSTSATTRSATCSRAAARSRSAASRGR